MPRNISGVYSLPAGSTITNGETSDASDINTPLADLANDANAVRPIVAGGTGAASASAARTALAAAGTAANETISGNWTFTGTTVLPTGTTIGGGVPGMDFLARTVASSSSAIGFLSQIDNTVYDHYILWCSALVPSSDGAVLRLRLSLDGSTYDSGTAEYGWGRQDMASLADGGAYAASGASSNALQITPALGSDATEYGFSGQIYIYGTHETKFPRVQWSGVGANLTATETGIQGYGRRNAVGPVLGMQLSFNAGNIETGAVILMGVRKA